ncbi:hypothetical protein QAD02_002238 [Eretmocerus hayati]|uniref:Uncharacterized protein n=1 Tax=Eretmocerus hayati TaxID=131215 RepID=A0ACC2NIM2_9HYME|nr:hypothetical protein QAD02_002238 [Eretmocerus hayati]
MFPSLKYDENKECSDDFDQVGRKVPQAFGSTVDEFRDNESAKLRDFNVITENLNQSEVSEDSKRINGVMEDELCDFVGYEGQVLTHHSGKSLSTSGLPGKRSVMLQNDPSIHLQSVEDIQETDNEGITSETSGLFPIESICRSCRGNFDSEEGQDLFPSEEFCEQCRDSMSDISTENICREGVMENLKLNKFISQDFLDPDGDECRVRMDHTLRELTETQGVFKFSHKSDEDETVRRIPSLPAVETEIPRDPVVSKKIRGMLKECEVDPYNYSLKKDNVLPIIYKKSSNFGKNIKLPESKYPYSRNRVLMGNLDIYDRKQTHLLERGFNKEHQTMSKYRDLDGMVIWKNFPCNRLSLTGEAILRELISPENEELIQTEEKYLANSMRLVAPLIGHDDRVFYCSCRNVNFSRLEARETPGINPETGTRVVILDETHCNRRGRNSFGENFVEIKKGLFGDNYVRFDEPPSNGQSSVNREVRSIKAVEAKP